MGRLEVKQVGEVAVDSGQVIIVDPCQMKDLDYLQSCVEKRFDLDMKFMEGNGHWPKRKYTRLGMKNVDARQIRLKYPVAVVSHSGIGDGMYPVYAEFVDDPAWGRRVASLTIDFGMGGFVASVAQQEAKRTKRNFKARCKRQLKKK